MTVYAIPLQPAQHQQIAVPLLTGTYLLDFRYHNVPEGGWVMDISDRDGNPLACGIAVVTGTDLLGQFEYLGIGGKIWVVSDGVPSDVPTWANLGTASHVYYEV